MHVKHLFRRRLNDDSDRRDPAPDVATPDVENDSSGTQAGLKPETADSSGEEATRTDGYANASDRVPVHYRMTTFFLRRCGDALTTDPFESIVYLTGMKIGSVIVLDEFVRFEMQERSVAYVQGNLVSSTAALIGLSDRGFELRGTAHSHPGRGRYATCPSGIDYAHHRRLEQGGYQALGIIFTRDGHVRFYSDQLPFRVQVVGKDGVWVEPNRIFKLDLHFRGESDESNNPTTHHENKRPEHTGSRPVPAGENPADAGGKGPAAVTD